MSFLRYLCLFDGPEYPAGITGRLQPPYRFLNVTPAPR
jgi:hypothetical protein